MGVGVDVIGNVVRVEISTSTLGSGRVIAVGNATVSLLFKLKEPWPAPNPG